LPRDFNIDLKPFVISAATPLRKSSAHIISIDDVGEDVVARWEALRKNNTIYQSPFFSIEFTRAVAQVREDVRVAVFEEGDQIVGLFPFQRLNRRTIVPVGGAYNDLHGLLGRVGPDDDFVCLLPSLDAEAFRFHAIVDNPSASIARHRYGRIKAYLADLKAHPEGYVRFLEKTRQTIFKQRKKSRKLEKDFGPLRLEFDCRDHAVLDQIIKMKRKQYQRTFIFDLLSIPWAQQMLHGLLDRNDQSARGLLSVLYAGDTLLAGHFGMIEDRMMHYWFPVYDFDHQQNSPGTALFLAIAEEATRRGIEKIDFGYGEQPYKVKLTDTITELPYGSVDRSRLNWLGHRCSTWLHDCRSRMPFKEMIKPIIRKLVPNLDGGQYQ
jgi:CelD/BcsL family acetyltransferase involved in cellulose biosynthesis